MFKPVTSGAIARFRTHHTLSNRNASIFPLKHLDMSRIPFQHCTSSHCMLKCLASRSADISDGTPPWPSHGFQSSNRWNVNSSHVGGGTGGVQDNFLSIVVSTVVEIYK